MLKQKSIIMSIAVLAMSLMVGCSQSDGNATSQESDFKADQEVIVINGYTLPPEPDPKINNATLLGVDVNNNGVRDDVERYLLKKYKDHHKIVSEIALQSGRAFQIILAHPENARETVKYDHAALFCNMYFKDDADSFGDLILIDDYITDYKYEELQLNTEERIGAYLEYNHKLSGGVYRQAIGLKAKALCDFNVTELLKTK